MSAYKRGGGQKLERNRKTKRRIYNAEKGGEAQGKAYKEGITSDPR